MPVNFFRPLAATLAFCLLLSGCGGSDDTTADSAPGAVKTGVFADSRVEGLSYSSPSFNGLTNAAGEYTYREGEMMTFKIGGINLGSVPSAAIITPRMLVPGSTLDTPAVLNISRLLLSLDTDGISSNSIQISDRARALAQNATINFDQPTSTFGAAGGAADNLVKANDPNRSVTDATTAKNELTATEADAQDGHINEIPVGDAGADQNVNEGSTVTLKGKGTDPDGTVVSAKWTQRAGTTVALSSTTAFEPTFTAPQVSAATDLKFQLVVTDNAGATSKIDEVVITVQDLATPAQSTLSVNSISAPEGDSGSKSFSFTITRAGKIDQAVSVRAATANVTATAGSDYVAADTVVAFASGETSKTFVVTVNGDTVVEGDETFTVNLTNPAGNATITGAQGTGTIQNDDMAPPDQSTLTVNDVSAPEGNSGTKTFAFTITRGGNTAQAVTVHVATADGTATAGSDYVAVADNTVSFASGETTKTVNVIVNGDTMTENDETFTVNLSAASANATIMRAQGTGTIQNDDNPPPGQSTLSINNVSMMEGNSGTKTFTFTITRDGNTAQAVSVNAATTNGTATAGSDYVAANALVNFASGDLSKTFDITVNGDTTVEPDETFTVNLSNPSANTTITTAQGTGTIQNDDTATPPPAPAGFPLCVPAGAPGAGSCLSSIPTLGPALQGAIDTLYNAITGGTTPPVTSIGCPADNLCVGASKSKITPTDAQIAGQMDDYFGGKRKQFFHLGGFGFGPFKLVPSYGGASPEVVVGNDPVALSNPPAKARCFSRSIAPGRITPTTCEDDTWVRVLVMQAPHNGVRVAFVTIDAVGAGNLIQEGVKKAVHDASCAKSACIETTNILFGQTHSHAGADLQGLWGGVPRDWINNVLNTAAATAVSTALDHAKSANLKMARGYSDEGANKFNSYRRPRYRSNTSATEPTEKTDHTVTLLQASAADGSGVLGSILQYAAHPTAIGDRDYSLSDGSVVRVPNPDFPLGVENELEKSGGTALYYNGPIADASGSGSTEGSYKGGTPYDAVKNRGENLAKLAESFMANAVTLDPVLTARSVEVILPVTNPLFLGVAAIGPFNGYYQFAQIPKDQIPGYNQLPTQINDVDAARNQLPQIAPITRTTVSRISIGTMGSTDVDKNRLEIVTIPGEATNTFGQYIRALAKESAATLAKPKTHTMILGLTHNSFGYIIPEEEFSYFDPSGDTGFVAPYTGYEEFVSLGPLTAPLLRAQGYNMLFDATPQQYLPPWLSDCAIGMNYRGCIVGVIQDRIAEVLGTNITGQITGGLTTLAGGCHDYVGGTPLSPACAVPDALAGAAGSGAPGGASADPQLIQAAADAQLRGCDPLDTTACLYPFPNDFFTMAAPAGSAQSSAKGGTGKRVNFNILAMPRNIVNKPIDPTEWNRNDGFSPGSMIVTLVPGLSLDKTYAPAKVISIASPSPSLASGTPIMVLDASDGYKQQLVWAEMDVTANVLLHTPTEFQGQAVPGGGQDIPNPRTFQQALIIRPAKNFEEGHRYIVVLRNLKDGSGKKIEAGAAFKACLAATDSALPPIKSRCDVLKQNVLTQLPASITKSDLFLAWDFTVASKANVTGRLDHMVKDALSSLANASPVFSINKTTANPQDGIARRIEGTLTVPSYVTPADPSPQDNAQLQQALNQITAQFPSQSGDVVALASTANAPPNRLFYNPSDAQNPSDPQGSLYGDGLPDRAPGANTMSVPFICQIPKSASASHKARAGVYGHGLLDSRAAVTYDGVPEMSREHNYMFCAVDFFGFATGDLPNVASTLVDLSNFPVVPDASQQGMVNFAFLARAIKTGFAGNPAFQDGSGNVLFDKGEVFYDGNSQGGILGAVIVASSPDVNRGVLGSLGMNYSTLLRRSKDFDPYAVPLYLSYQDAYDRTLAFSLMQMLWDRSENDGYAQALRNNPQDQLASNGGADNFVLLNSQFGDHQVSMWTADVMARSIGIPASYQMNDRVQNGTGINAPLDTTAPRHPDVKMGGSHVGLSTLTYSSAQITGSALVNWDDRGTAVPPVVELPPRPTGAANRDPHDDSAKKFSGRCQKAMFLRTDGKIIDITGIEFDGAACPDLEASDNGGGGGTPATGIAAAITRWMDAMTTAFGQFPKDPMGASDAFLAGNTQLVADLVGGIAQTAGQLAGLGLSPPSAGGAVNNPDPAPLMAGAAEGAVRVPVGTPLGGYLRPPVGGEYLPGAEAIAGGDPNVFLKEFLDFTPSVDDACDQNHPESCTPSAPIPDELRKLHSPYATYSPPSRGYYDSLIAKAVAMYDGNDCVILMKTDFVGMIDEIVQAVAEDATKKLQDAGKLPRGCDLKQGLVMSATHTHDGPGAVGNHSVRYFWLALDAYQPEIFERIVPMLSDVVVRSLSNMELARFGYAIGQEADGANGQPTLNHFRRKTDYPQFDNNCDDDGLCNVGMRKRLGVLRVDKLDGSPLALVMNYASHGIAFDVENQYFSGDVLASAEREVAASFNKPVVAMLVQNTGGNVTPSTGDGPTLQRIERFGKLLAPQVRAIYDGVNNFDTRPDLRAVSQRIVLNREKIGYPDKDGKNGDGDYPYPNGAAQCNNDAAVPFADKGVNDVPGYPAQLPHKLPGCIAAPPPDAIDLADNGVGENGTLFPQDTRLTAVKIGSATLLTQPGEPLSEYGVRLLKAARNKGFDTDKMFIWGYSQDHVGYIMEDDKEDWSQGGTEGTTTFWGWKLGDRLIKANEGLMVALKNGTAPPADELTVNYNLYRDIYKKVPRYQPTPSARPGRVITRPKTIEHFQQTSFAWEGGDPVLDFPSVTMQQCDASGANCVDAKRPNGTVLDTFYEMHLKYRLVTAAHVWTVDFESPKDWPAGKYRFKVSGMANQVQNGPYSLTSDVFEIKVSPTLQLALSGDNKIVTVKYAPRPTNYRLIDPLVDVKQAAPVREGRVEFLNAAGAVIATTVCQKPLSADCSAGIYRTTVAGAMSARAVDGSGNTGTASQGSGTADADGDGVPDSSDACPNTPAGETVNASGCSASQQASSGFPVCQAFMGSTYCLSDIPTIGPMLQAAVNTAYSAAMGGGTPAAPVLPEQTTLIAAAADAQLRGCDLLDPANCLYPFPSDQFTAPAAAGSPQSVAKGGTGKRINFNIAAMPRNAAGKPIDPTEWNRNDGFSPGAMILTYVPNLGTVKDASGKPLGPIKGAVPLTDLNRYTDADAPILVLDAATGVRYPVWAEIDVNAGFILPAVSEQASPLPKKPALIVRPAKNFIEGHRYVVVLRNLKDDGGKTISAQAPFKVCRDGDAMLGQIPAVKARCDELKQKVFPVLATAGIAIDPSLYLAWDFTVASAANDVSRLVHMRDDAFASLGDVKGSAPGQAGYPAGNAPSFAVTEVMENPDGNNGKTVRRIRGTFKVPSYVIPADPAPASGNKSLQDQLKKIADQCQQITQGNCGIPGVANVGDGFELATAANLPPNRLFYRPDDGAPAPDPSNVQDPVGVRYGDGMPDRNPAGDLTTTFTCDIPRSAISGKSSMTAASSSDIKPVRPTVYGHGLLGGQGEVNGQASDFGNVYGLMNCAIDWFGFASGDLPNVASALVDLSNFPVVPDASQQGMLNQMFLARLMVHPKGFAGNASFQVSGRPVFDRREVFYHGNSQGGILGGVLVAASKDINRGVLGVLGMNYSTLLSRSTDFATYSIPLYLSYQDDLDRPFIFSLMQMLWDRSENNGYAEHLTDNSAMGGPNNQVLLTPALGDHQVSMWTADVMARTVGARVDRHRIRSSRHPDADNAEYALMEPLDYTSAAHRKGSALVPYDQMVDLGTGVERWNSQNDDRCDGNKTNPPPIGNKPPGAVAGDDPHECPRRDPQARCQASHFLLRAPTVAGDTSPEMVDVSGINIFGPNADSGADCPAVIISGAPTDGGGDTPIASAPNYGSGLLGVIAQFFSNLNSVIAALVGGDAPTAGSSLQAALTSFGNSIAGIFSDPTKPETVIGLDTDVQSAINRAKSANRDVEAVVVTGAQLPGWSSPAAQGAPYPYPSGANITGQNGNTASLAPLNQARDPAMLGEVRNAHNGVILYPQAGVPALGVPVDQIAAYAFKNGAFTEIPVQVDEKYPFFLANAGSSFSVYSGTDEELTYAWDKERWNPDESADQCTVVPKPGVPDPVAGLDDDDEVVFMAADAGDRAPQGQLPMDVTAGSSGQQLLLADPLDPSKQRYVYLFRKPTGSSFKTQHYVSYQRDANADRWIDRDFFADNDPEKIGTSNTGYGPNLKGKVCDPVKGKRDSTDRFPRDGVSVSTDTYHWHASGRWMVRDLRVKGAQDPAPQSELYWATRPDLIDRWKGRAFQQSPDSTISVVGFEDEQVNWEANSIILGERCGPVRCMREIWGADSGTNVTKTETFYRDAVTYRFHLRVHPIPPDGLYTSWDYSRGVMVPTAAEKAQGIAGGRYYTVLRPQGVPIDGVNDDVGQVDTLTPIPGINMCMTLKGPQPAAGGKCPAFLDVADPTFNLPLAFDNWEQISGKGGSGSLVYLFELKGATSATNPAVAPFYRDDACLDDGTGDDPVPRPYPGEATTDSRVQAGYAALAGKPYAQLKCEEKQGDYGSNGIHFFVTHDSDNAFVEGKPIDEVDGQQWQFMVPTGQPKNVGETYANVARFPLKAFATPIGAPGLPITSGGSGFLGALAGLLGDLNAPLQNLLSGNPSGAVAALQVAGANFASRLQVILTGNGQDSAPTLVANATTNPSNPSQTFANVLRDAGRVIGLPESVLSGSSVKAGVGVVDMTPDVGYCAGQYCAGPNNTANVIESGVSNQNPAVIANIPGAVQQDTVSGDSDPYVTAKSKQKSYGVQSRLTARAIVIQGNNGKRIALLKTDNYLAQDNLLRRVGQLLDEHGTSGVHYDDILYHVTHNHSAAYSATLTAGPWVFEDVYDARFFENQARKMAAAIELAAANLKPARMGATTVRHTIYKGNVVRPSVADDGTPAGYPKEFGDHGLVVMRFDDVSNPTQPKPLAVWVNWGEHPESLNGYGLHSADYLAPLERFVERDLGVPLVFSQADVGSSENSGNDDQIISDDGKVCGKFSQTQNTCGDGTKGVLRDWNHKGYVQTERNARFLADAIVDGWNKIDSTAAQVGFNSSFPVDHLTAWTPGPLSHPYPSVSNCRTQTTVDGNAGIPAAGLPDCARENNEAGVSGQVFNGLSGAGVPVDRRFMIWQTMKAEGIPVPENYDANSFGVVEENARLKLQTFRLGDVLLASCACEAQVDLILNLESRLDTVKGNIYDGFDYACLLPNAVRNDTLAHKAACDLQEQYYDGVDIGTIPGSTTNTGLIAHMRAQIHNPADGWDAPDYVPYANSEPTDLTKIKGNFTKQEIQDLGTSGYKLAVGVGHAGDYNGYTVSYREYMNRDSYRKALTTYGPHTADYMVTRLVRMAAQLQGGPKLAPEPHDALAQADEARQVALATAHGQATAKTYAAWQAALPPDVGPAIAKTQPQNIPLFSATTFRWRGGGTQVDNPIAVVERETSPNVWTKFADMTGEVQTRVHWPQGVPGMTSVYTGQFAWEWTANFEAYKAFPARLGSTPLGAYRFVVKGCINDAVETSFQRRLGLEAGSGCPGGSHPYQLTSTSFNVTDGAAKRSYIGSVFPFIQDNSSVRICDQCTFRPWASSVN